MHLPARCCFPSASQRRASAKRVPIANEAFNRETCYSERMTDAETIAHLKAQLTKAGHIVKMQVEEIDRLRAEVDRLVGWVTGERDALSALQVIYNDTEASEANRVKAAAAAIGYERPKIVIQGYANMTSLARRLDEGRQPKVIEHSSNG